MTDFLKAISLWQPWASLWLSPNKLHETRHWSTAHRGPLLVHAAKRIEFDISDELEGIVSSEFGGHWGMELPRGAIIGMVDVVDVVPTEKTYEREMLDGAPTDAMLSDFECGDFSDGRFGWRRGTYHVFREPIPFKGHQRIFNVPRDLVAEAIAAAKVVAA